jgi:Type II CAAX prenyl endopeptidase Rce1-like
MVSRRTAWIALLLSTFLVCEPSSAFAPFVPSKRATFTTTTTTLIDRVGGGTRGSGSNSPPAAVGVVDVQNVRHGSGPLRYRPLDDGDDEIGNPAMLKVMSRAPPGYKMKDALHEQREQQLLPPSDQQRQGRSGLNQSLIQALTFNQFLILGFATAVATAIVLAVKGISNMDLAELNDILLWTGAGTSVFDFSVTLAKVLWGIGGALPLLAFSTLIETSDYRAFANINFSTITMCMTLFGRRSAPPAELVPESFKGIPVPTTSPLEAALQSLKLSLVTGFCEEVVFRRIAPAMLLLRSGGDGDLLWPFVGQAVLFGLGHIQPSNKLAENAILFGLQLFNGLGFGALYYLTGGDIVPCIIAHAFYDFVTFFKTWTDANDQLEYAERMWSQPLPPEVEREVQQSMRASAEMDPKRYSAMKRLFYIFDFDKNETLSLSEVRKGLAYMAVEKAGTLPERTKIARLFEMAKDPGNNANRISFPEFMRLLALMNPKNTSSSNKPRVPVLLL